MTGVVLLKLVLAHVLTDFVLQPNSWIAHKRLYKVRSVYLYIHAILSGFLSLLLLQHWEFWYVGLGIAVTHFFIDWWKLKQHSDTLKYFLLDQFFHGIVILIAGVYILDAFMGMYSWGIQLFSSVKFLAVSIAYLLVIFPVGFLIGKATANWQEEINAVAHLPSLQKAGRYIGIFERVLVLTFVLSNHFSAIGFLIAAKSILRFSDKAGNNARKQTEYVLIGTLMSFAITIIIGMLTRQFVF